MTRTPLGIRHRDRATLATQDPNSPSPPDVSRFECTTHRFGTAQPVRKGSSEGLIQEWNSKHRETFDYCSEKGWAAYVRNFTHTSMHPNLTRMNQHCEPRATHGLPTSPRTLDSTGPSAERFVCGSYALHHCTRGTGDCRNNNQEQAKVAVQVCRIVRWSQPAFTNFTVRSQKYCKNVSIFSGNVST